MGLLSGELKMDQINSWLVRLNHFIDELSSGQIGTVGNEQAFVNEARSQFDFKDGVGF
jgi:hypothetical protein